MVYSAPATLSMLAQSGRLPQYDMSSLRMVLFAGEVMPIVHLRSFKTQVPARRFLNLYGPTETNVCTWYEIPRTIPKDRIEPYPIGRTCSHLQSMVVDEKGNRVSSLAPKGSSASRAPMSCRVIGVGPISRPNRSCPRMLLVGAGTGLAMLSSNSLMATIGSLVVVIAWSRSGLPGGAWGNRGLSLPAPAHPRSCGCGNAR